MEQMYWKNMGKIYASFSEIQQCINRKMMSEISILRLTGKHHDYSETCCLSPSSLRQTKKIDI